MGASLENVDMHFETAEWQQIACNYFIESTLKLVLKCRPARRLIVIFVNIELKQQS